MELPVFMQQTLARWNYNTVPPATKCTQQHKWTSHFFIVTKYHCLHHCNTVRHRFWSINELPLLNNSRDSSQLLIQHGTTTASEAGSWLRCSAQVFSSLPTNDSHWGMCSSFNMGVPNCLEDEILLEDTFRTCTGIVDCSVKQLPNSV